MKSWQKYCNSGCRKHSYSSKCDTVKSACLVCNKDTNTDQKDRECCGFHTNSDTADALYKIDSIMNGDLNELMDALAAADQAQRLNEQT